MDRKIVSDEENEVLIKQLITNWDISKHYWYPLYDCKRNDVIAFNADFVEDDDEKVLSIKEALINQGDTKIFEMQENRLIYVIDTISLEPYYDGRLGERFWFRRK